MLLSIIVPIYKVEQYIRPCVLSIFEQDMDDSEFELILVDDGTPDNSFEKINDIINNHHNIVVLKQPNSGLSVARNTGLKAAKGDYVLFVDSDDLLVKKQLRHLLDKATEEIPDLLITKFTKLTDDEIEKWEEDKNSNNEYQIKTGTDVFINDLNPQQCYVWRTLYRREFLINNNLFFIPGLYFEDIPFTTECYILARKCILTSTLLYIYRQRQNSIVSSITKEKLLHMNRIVEYLWNLKQNHSYPIQVNKKLKDIIFVTFSICIWYISHDENVRKNRQEITQDLHQKISSIKFTNGLKQRLTSFIFNLCPNIYIYIRSFLR